MKRYFRIIRILLYGKYKYLKRVNKWRRGQLLRDLQLLTPQYYQKYIDKYGGENYTTILEWLNSNEIKAPPPSSPQEK